MSSVVVCPALHVATQTHTPHWQASSVLLFSLAPRTQTPPSGPHAFPTQRRACQDPSFTSIFCARGVLWSWLVPSGRPFLCVCPTHWHPARGHTNKTTHSPHWQASSPRTQTPPSCPHAFPTQRRACQNPSFTNIFCARGVPCRGWSPLVVCWRVPCPARGHGNPLSPTGSRPLVPCTTPLSPPPPLPPAPACPSSPTPA